MSVGHLVIKITPWSRILLQKLNLSRNSQTFMKHKGVHKNPPNAGPYPIPDEPNLDLKTPLEH